MDDSFQLRANRLLAARPRPAPLDHRMLSAALSAQQAASPTACAQARCVRREGAAQEADPLTELLLAGSGWQRAASDQHGCFNRAESERRRNVP